MLRRRRPTTERIALAALVLMSLAADRVAAQDVPQDGDATVLDTFLATVHTLSARFEQELWSADQRLIETASGELWLQRPNRFRWHYHAPYEQLIVSDGTQLWMHDVELEQVTVAPLDDAAGPSPALLLSGDDAVRDSFDVTAQFSHDGLDWIRLQPRPAGGDFTAVLAGFNGNELQSIEFVDGLDQTTRITFVDMRLNVDIAADLFHFDPPPGVDVFGPGR